MFFDSMVVILTILVLAWWLPLIVHIIRNGFGKLKNVWSILLLIIGLVAEAFLITSPITDNFGFGSWEDAIICAGATQILLIVYVIQWIRKPPKKGLALIVSFFFLMMGVAMHQYAPLLICGALMLAVKTCQYVCDKLKKQFGK